MGSQFDMTAARRRHAPATEPQPAPAMKPRRVRHQLRASGHARRNGIAGASPDHAPVVVDTRGNGRVSELDDGASLTTVDGPGFSDHDRATCIPHIDADATNGENVSVDQNGGIEVARLKVDTRISIGVCRIHERRGLIQHNNQFIY